MKFITALAPLALLMGSLASTTVSAQVLGPEADLSGRPSASRPELPSFEPSAPPPGLEVPEVPAETGTPGPVSGPSFRLKGFRFDGNTVFPDSRLQNIAAPYTNRPITMADLEELRHRLTLLYVTNGYVNSGALIPDQRVTDGVVEIRIVEGRLGEIEIRGNDRLDPDYIADRLRLGAGPPLNTNELQERFQLLLTDPLFDHLNGSLGPGLEPGEAILDLNVTRAEPYELSVSFDNYVPPDLGSEEIRLDGLVRNLTGYGDTLSLLARGNKHNNGFAGRFAIPVNRYDTKLWGRYEYTDSSVVNGRLDDLDIKGKVKGWELGVSHPVHRTLNRTVTLGAALSVRKSKNHLLHSSFSFSPGETNGKSKVTALRLSQEFIGRGTRRVIAVRSTLSLGLHALGSSNHQQGRPDSSFVAWLGQLEYAGKVLDNGAQLVVRSDLQLANRNLLPLEQISVGGRYSVRGYRENELVRDQAYIGSVEFQYPLLQTGAVDWFPGALRVAPFADYGYGWDKGRNQNGKQLFAVGVGLLWSFPPRLTAELFLAHDVDSAPNHDDDDLQDRGISFRITGTIF